MDEVSGREQRVVIRWRNRTQTEALRPALGNAYPPNETTSFDDALKAIDEAERKVWGDRDPGDRPPG